MGFWCLARGAGLLDIVGLTSPCYVLKHHPDLYPAFAGLVVKDDMYFVDTEATRRLMTVNDNYAIERETLREQVIKEIFAEIGDEVEFIN